MRALPSVAAATVLYLCLASLAPARSAPRGAAVPTPRATPQVPEAVDLDMLQRLRDEGFRRSQVMDTLAHLTDVIGPRLTNSPRNRQAHEWTRARLAAWGLSNAHVEPWGPFGPGWSLERCSVHMLAPNTTPLVAWPKAWSPGTGGPLRGRALHAPIASEADFEAWKGKLAGRIVLLGPAAEIAGLEKPALTRMSAVELAESAQYEIPKTGSDRMSRFRGQRRFGRAAEKFLAEEKPLAVIQPSGREAGIVRVMGLSQRGKDAARNVPYLVMAAESYNHLVRLLERGLDVELELDLRVKFHDDATTAANTLAELPGAGPRKDEVVMLGAHLDSWHAGTGATDNGAGVAVVMEAMRLLASVGAAPRRTIRAGLWSGEEQGLLGSIAYVRQHLAWRPDATEDDPGKGRLELRPEHARFSAYFNLDAGTGRVRGLFTMENTAAQPILAAWIQPLRDLGVEVVSPRRDFGTDHLSFDGAGLPAFNLMQDPIEYETLTHHTNLDVFDRVKREDLMQASVVMAFLAWQAAQRDELMPRKPLPARSPFDEGSPAPAAGASPTPAASPRP